MDLTSEGAVMDEGLRDQLVAPVDHGMVSSSEQAATRTCPEAGPIPGIDVSGWQGNIDWARVKAAGIQFAFIRLSDGAKFRDSKFERNWAGAKAAGVIRGVYQFFRPEQSATAQADMMIAAIGAHEPGDLPPVIDVEEAGGLPPATVAGAVRTWVDRVQAALGVAPIIYTGPAFWRSQVGAAASFAPNALWIAQWSSREPNLPAPWSRWTFWQYTNKGSIDGISGDVDRNWFNGSLAELQELCGAA